MKWRDHKNVSNKKFRKPNGQHNNCENIVYNYSIQCDIISRFEKKSEMVQRQIQKKLGFIKATLNLNSDSYYV